MGLSFPSDLIMTLLNPDGTSEENAEIIVDIPSYIVVSSAGIIFCGFFSLSALFFINGYISLIEIFFMLFFPAIVGIIATVYAVWTLIEKKMQIMRMQLDIRDSLKFGQ